MAATATPVDWNVLKQLSDAGLSSDQIRALGSTTPKSSTPSSGEVMFHTPEGDSNPATPGLDFAGNAATRPPQQVTASDADKADQRTATSSSAALVLKQYGLEALIPIVNAWIQGGMSWEEAQLAFYDNSTEAGKIFDARFPAIRIRRENGLPPISPAEYVSYENTATQYLRAAGLPKGFYDTKDDFTSLIAGDVSPAELQGRIQDGYVAATSAPADVKAELYNYYGVDDAHLAAYFLDPNRALPLIQRQVASAKIGAASTRVGVGIQQGTAENLAAMGVNDSTAGDLFAKVANDLPNLQTLQQRFNDPADPLTADSYANALVISDPTQLQHVARLVGQEKSLFSQQGLFSRNDQGGLTGLLDR